MEENLVKFFLPFKPRGELFWWSVAHVYYLMIEPIVADFPAKTDLSMFYGAKWGCGQDKWWSLWIRCEKIT